MWSPPLGRDEHPGPVVNHPGFTTMNQQNIRIVLLGSYLLSAAALTTAAYSAEPASVKVDLSDKGGKYSIIMSSDHAKAGTVEFNIKNTSSKILHEFLITPWKGAITALPYDVNKGQVVEEKLPKLAGVEDMKPGAEAILRLPLKPGRYVVFCDQPGHYKMGMVTRFTVTP
jgi:uncharacterized cupredoxin-like copper-binding protein